jgi:hypothetical protein
LVAALAVVGTVGVVAGAPVTGPPPSAQVTTAGAAGIDATGDDVGVWGQAPLTLRADDSTAQETIPIGEWHAEVTVDGSKLSVDVGLEETETDMCESCIGAISYEATVSVAEMKGLNTASVSHPNGSSYGASWQSASAGARDPESN